jgi:hypothetical protein
MKCPGCKHEFRLTMREYLREPRGRHNCPACRRRFRLKYSFSSVILLILAVLITAGIPGFLAYILGGGWLLGLVCYFVGACLFALPIDRWLDDSWREAVEI